MVLGGTARGAGLDVNSGQARLVNCTVAGNVADGGMGSGEPGCVTWDLRGRGVGGGIANSGLSVELFNCVVAGNRGVPRAVGPDTYGTLRSGGRNFVGKTNEVDWLEPRDLSPAHTGRQSDGCRRSAVALGESGSRHAALQHAVF